MDVDVQESPIEPHTPYHDPGGSVTPPVQTANSKNLPLAPLEYLQNQRRGSITDPFLHAHIHPTGNGKDTSPNPSSHSSNAAQTPPDQDFPPRTKSAPLVIRPSSPYVFGDATAKPARPSNPPSDKNLRKLLHSTTPPAPDSPFQCPSSASQQTPEPYTRAVSGPPEPSNQHINSVPEHRGLDHPDDSEHRERVKHKFNDLEVSDRLPSDFPRGFDWGMRRHSIATGGGGPHPYQPRTRRDQLSRSKLKRKISSDPHFVDDEDAEYVPGLPLGTDARMGSLSLYDRRDSASYFNNSINTSSTQPWDRRDSVVSTYSNLSSTGGYPSSAISNESPKNLAPHPWLNLPPVTINDDKPHSVLQKNHRPFPQHATLPNGFDRRMSVPEINHRGLSEHGNRRVRPRTDVRETFEIEHSKNTHQTNNDLCGSERTHHPNSSPKSTMSNLVPPPREGGAPYSRSPELRVSHKLAERKRRKEMKELFDELRDQLPADRSMKSSKWEILSKAIDHIINLTASLAESQRQVELLRIELDKTRDPHYSHISNPPIVHSQGPNILNYPSSGRSNEVSGSQSSTPPSANLRSGSSSYTLPQSGGGHPPP